jgi:hypothetical protein
MKKQSLLIRTAIIGITLGALLIAGASLLASHPSTNGLSLVSLVQAQGEDVELTVYNQDIALVRDTRPFNLEQGVNEVRFAEVASQIDPTSVHFRSLTDPEGTVVLEQNYEYDIVGSQKLLQKYVDQDIELVTEDGTEYKGTLLSGAGDIILQDDDGSVTVVRLDRVQQYNFPELPEGLITKPTLVWLLDAERSGDQDVEVTYMTGGINWRADYVVQLNEDDTALDLNGWITLDNNSGATYNDAKLKLVAGDLNVVREVQAFDRGMILEAECYRRPCREILRL